MTTFFNWRPLLRNRNLFALWFKNTSQTDFVVNFHFICFLVRLPNGTFCHTSSKRNLFTLWFKNTLQTDFVVNIHFMCFQVRFSNGTLCHSCSLWLQQNICNAMVDSIVVSYQNENFSLKWELPAWLPPSKKRSTVVMMAASRKFSF